jgi:hypothetical protein
MRIDVFLGSKVLVKFPERGRKGELEVGFVLYRSMTRT